MKELEPVEKKICRACEKEKKITSFTKLSTGNRGGVCNLCKSLGNTIKDKKSSKKELTVYHPLQLGNPSQMDYEFMYKSLEKMGYNLSQDIYKQFCKKYNLRIREPKKTFLNHYSPKDCGLI